MSAVELHVLPSAEAKSADTKSLWVPSLSLTVGFLANQVRAVVSRPSSEPSVLCVRKMWDPPIMWEPLRSPGVTLETAGIDDTSVLTLVTPEEADGFDSAAPSFTRDSTAVAGDSSLPRPTSASLSLGATIAADEENLRSMCARPRTTGDLLRFRARPTPASLGATDDPSKRPPSRLAQPSIAKKRTEQPQEAPAASSSAAQGPAAQGNQSSLNQEEIQRFFQEITASSPPQQQQQQQQQKEPNPQGDDDMMYESGGETEDLP